MRSRAKDSNVIVPAEGYRGNLLTLKQRRIVRRVIVTGAILFSAVEAMAATAPPFPEAMNASEIQLRLQKLNVLGRVLYLAAHPDDENTTLISLWSNGSLYDAGYLSITRGDGGQNLLGSELREKLGLIRTQELLAARRVDHGQQFFTRAVDFGFSKNPEETLRFWDHDKILSDVVWVIRRFRPDVVVTRFSPEDRLTHGHHTASAILATEGFPIAGDAKKFPDQLALVKPWQPKRLVWNTSPFFFTNRKIPFDPTGLTTLEAGGYNALLGKAYTEMAAESVSMHKSQGVGSPARRGARTEYFKPLAGEPMNTGVFDAIDTTWKRVPGSEAVAAKISKVTAEFRPSDPAATVPGLLQIRDELDRIKEDDWAPQKKAEVDQIIAACLGLHLEASTETPIVSPGQELPVKIEAINRSNVAVDWISYRLASAQATSVGESMPIDKLVTKEIKAAVPGETKYSQPYWLRQPAAVGTFTVEDQDLIGRPTNLPHFPAEITIKVASHEITYSLDTKYRTVDPIAGEVRNDIVIAPPVFANFVDPVLVFPNANAKNVRVRVLASDGPVKGDVHLSAPNGWSVLPSSIPIDLRNANAEKDIEFSVHPPKDSGEGNLKAVVTVGGQSFSFARERIAYPHIGVHILMPPAEAKLVRADIQTNGRVIGYIPGAGDDIPAALQQIGYTVKQLGEGDFAPENLRQFSAIVLGVRIFNSQDRIATWMPALIEYAKGGGVVVVQYNTTADLKSKDLGPYPLELSRDRVTDETAEVKFLAPEHPVLNTPNRITAHDFEGWVQERGLYFPDKWDPAWVPILSSHDPDEKPLDGGLLVAKVDKGYFVYTGYSWFRQLPAGVPGAYRIFANMVSLGGK
jgi:LmbE family N-acetylglucosaminyl deacetylase